MRSNHRLKFFPANFSGKSEVSTRDLNGEENIEPTEVDAEATDDETTVSVVETVVAEEDMINYTIFS